MLVELRGLCVAIPPAKPYDFEDGDRRMQGIARKAWMIQSVSSEPTIVRFDDANAAAFDNLRAACVEANSPVACAMSVEAGQRVKFVAWVEEPARAKAAAAR